MEEHKPAAKAIEQTIVVYLCIRFLRLFTMLINTPQSNPLSRNVFVAASHQRLPPPGIRRCLRLPVPKRHL
jgi:hypothetical protein